MGKWQDAERCEFSSYREQETSHRSLAPEAVKALLASLRQTIAKRPPTFTIGYTTALDVPLAKLNGFMSINDKSDNVGTRAAWVDARDIRIIIDPNRFDRFKIDYPNIRPFPQSSSHDERDFVRLTSRTAGPWLPVVQMEILASAFDCGKAEDLHVRAAGGCDRLPHSPATAHRAASRAAADRPASCSRFRAAR